MSATQVHEEFMELRRDIGRELERVKADATTAERERCAKIAREMREVYEHGDDCGWNAADGILEEILKGE